MTKIEALEKTIYKIESGEYEYNWWGVDQCNCGLVAKTLLGGKNVKECGFYDLTKDIICGGFAANVTHTILLCSTSGLPLPEAHRVLKNASFSHDELDHLELLSNPDILERAGIDYAGRDYGDKSKLLAYLKAWVELLNEETKPAIKERIVYVAIDAAIKEQKLILS